jgi:predicted nucleic-acid-binding Zn-ribbon protein
MAKIQNYNKTCDKCNGKYLLGTIEGKVTGIFFGLFAWKEPDTHIVCDKCIYGVLYPKEIIQKADRFEPIVKY